LKKLTCLVFGILIISSLVFGQSAAPEKVTSRETSFTYWTPETGQWVEDPDAPGTYGKDVTGSPATGNWVMYVKINPGAWIKWHWHSNPQTIYAVSGTMDYEVRPHKSGQADAGLLSGRSRTRIA
jgi:oxalate decarboxylase/phosphoglucose isomerase-like protein (cupin superfamily)